MPEIVATVGDPAANSYLTLEEADRQMDSYPNAKAWLDLDEATRQRHLLDITRKVDRYQNWTPFTSTQALAFPSFHSGEGVIPKEVIEAVLEGLDWKASDEFDSLKKLQAEGVTSRSIMGQSSQFKTDRSQLPAGSRNALDGLWSKYNKPVVQNRPSNQDRLSCDIQQTAKTDTTFGGDNSIFK